MLQISTFVIDYPFFFYQLMLCNKSLSTKAKILNTSQYNHRLSTTIIIFVQFERKKVKIAIIWLNLLTYLNL